MKSSLTDSKRLAQKKIGYSATYADKYKIKSLKGNGGEQRVPVHQERNINKAEGGQTSSIKSSHILSPNTQTRTHKKSNEPILEAEWMGRDFRIIQSQQQSSLISPQNETEKTLSSIEPSSPHELTLKKHSNILIEQELQEDLDIYNNYRMIQKQYLQEMQKIKQQRQKIEKECKNQRKKIAQAEQLLLERKRKLHQIEAKYQNIKNKSDKQRKQQLETIEGYERTIVQLNQDYERVKAQKAQELLRLSKELVYSKGQNNKLQSQLVQLEEELQLYQQNSNEQQMKTMEQLETQQEQLRKDIQNLQLQEETLRTQLQKLNSQAIQEPTIAAQHDQYLTTYQHAFLLNQLQRAEQLLRLKQVEKHEREEIQKRKCMIKQKQIELTLKEKRINEKHKLIDQLTQDIREKSTLLLNLYQQQHQ